MVEKKGGENPLMNKEEIFNSIYNRGIKLVAARPRSQKEMCEYILKKVSSYQLPEQEQRIMVENILQKLTEKKFINDNEFVLWWVEQRTYFKPKGVRALRAELLGKGIDKDVIDAFFEEQPLEEILFAKVALEKKMRLFIGLPQKKRFQKAIHFLLRRGFSYEASKKAFEELTSIE